MAGRIKVLFVNHVSEISGAETGLLDMVTHLDPARFACRVVLPHGGPLVDALAEHGVPTTLMSLQRFHRVRRPGVLARYAADLARRTPQMMRLVRTEQIDILHANSNTAHLYAGGTARLTGVPAIWHCRDLVDLGAAGRWMGLLTTRAVAISDAVARHLKDQHVPPGRLCVIPNGIDLERFRPGHALEARQRLCLGLRPEHKVFTTIGQLVPWKKQDVFLGAAAMIAAKVPEARFLVVGADLFGDHPDYEQRLHELASRPDLDGRVVFAGYRRDIADILTASDVVLHAADREPFGRAIVEAMACGVPVAAADACGPADIIRDGENGLLVPPGNAEALGHSGLRLATDAKLASRLGKAAASRARETFGLDMFIARMSRLYESIMEERKA